MDRSKSGGSADDSDDARVADAVVALRGLVLAAQTFRQDFAHSLGLTVTDTVAMSHLAAASSLSAGELAQRTGLAPSSGTAMIDRLERRGLAARVTRPNNRRSVEITLTDAGAAALTEPAQFTRAALLELGLEQLPELTRLFLALSQSLHRSAAAFTDSDVLKIPTS